MTQQIFENMTIKPEDASRIIMESGQPYYTKANIMAIHLSLECWMNLVSKGINPEGVEKMKTILQDIIENSDSGLIIRPGSYTYKAIEEALTSSKLQP